MEEPESVSEVSELLGRFGDSAKIYAGGTELLLAMKEGLVEYERLINVKKLKCKDVTVENGALAMGALCTHRELETSRTINEKLPALAKLEHNVANVRVR
ncbi:MAG: FAD binding domain-containing protein, partial [Deltaproteobacteria bacterium]